LFAIFWQFFEHFRGRIQKLDRFFEKGAVCMLDVFPDRKSQNGFGEKTGKWPIFGCGLDRGYRRASVSGIMMSGKPEVPPGGLLC
jgi:hypothetical protein